MRFVSTIASALGLLVVASTALAVPDVIGDPTFADADWSIVPFVTGDPDSFVEATQTTDGHPAPSRRVHVALVVSPPPSPTEFSTMYGIHLFAGKTYNPSTQGPFTNVDYFEDALLVQGFGDGQATGAALRQAGNVYIRQVGATPDFAWTTKADVGVPASAFVRIFAGGFDNGSHPDFTAAGPIEFGFFRANSTSPGATGYETVALIDNWTVLVNPPCVDNGDCVYPDACFVGACVAGTCKATAMVCNDDGDPCTNDVCVAGACETTPVVCDDGDPCTVDACGASGCTVAPLDCDDALPCTVDACVEGSCEHGLDFVTIQSAIDGLLVLLDAPPCAGDGVAARTRKKLVKKLTKARAKLGLADAAVRARLVTRFVGKTEHLLDVATKVLDKASDGGKVSPDCATSIASYLASLLTCTETLPPP